MGGPGSGRWPDESPRKETTEDYFALDIREAKRYGLIAPDQQELPGLAHIEWITSGFCGAAAGGCYLRPWFLCPRDECGKRVAILYGRIPETGAPSWACRTCRDLCYPVERENRAERALRKLRKARARIGPPESPRPKRMRHKTFVRLGRAYLQAAEDCQDAMQEQLSWHLKQMHFEQMQHERWLLGVEASNLRSAGPEIPGDLSASPGAPQP